MQIKDVSVPDIYTDSADFRFFLRWFENALTKIQYDTENGMNLYDPLKVPANLLWMLADTIGFKYDDRLPTSFNRFVLLYFMSIIRNRGSKDGVTLAAEVNLKQFDIELLAGTGYKTKDGGEVLPKDILYDRLEDTSLPVNSAVVTPHTSEGYIDVVYFSDRVPVDACVEYARPVGMYCFQNAGVRFDSKTKLSVDARLTNLNDLGVSIGPTHVGHYSRNDYARMQKTLGNSNRIVTGATDWVTEVDPNDKRRNVWYRNADYEGGLEDIPVQSQSDTINPGYRSMYSLQLCNNEHIIKSLLPSKPGQVYPSGEESYDRPNLFGLGWEPQDVSYRVPDDYKLSDVELDQLPGGRIRPWNLRYDKTQEESEGPDVYTIDVNRSRDILNPRPAINPIMKVVGDGVSMKSDNTRYMIAVNPDGTYPIDSANISENGQITATVQNGEITIGEVEPSIDGDTTGIYSPEDAIITEDRTILKTSEGHWIRAKRSHDEDKED